MVRLQKTILFYSIWLVLGLLIPLVGFAQKISNISVSVDNLNKEIIIYYDLKMPSSGKTICEFAVFLSKNGGLFFNEKPLKFVSGHIGKEVLIFAKQTRKITWQYAKEDSLFDGKSTVFKIKASCNNKNIEEMSEVKNLDITPLISNRPSTINVPDIDFDITKLNKIEGKNYGVFIGISKYDDKAFKPLDRPVNDAHKLRNTLIELYTFDQENTIVLENPSRKAIIDVFNDLATQISPKDNVLIFYAGHGIMSRNISYWILSDATADDESTWFSNSELKDKLNKIDSKHTLLIVDAPFSGAIFLNDRTLAGKSKNNPSDVLNLYNNRSRRAFSSSGFTEAFDNNAFIEALIGNLVKNKERFLSAHNLSMSVIETVLNQSSQFQIPQYGSIPGLKDEGGSFIFIRKGSNNEVKVSAELLFLRESAEKGDAVSQVKLGKFLEQGSIFIKEKSEEAFSWYKKSAESGETEGMVNLARMYKTGLATKKDYTRAKEWYVKAYVNYQINRDNEYYAKSSEISNEIAECNFFLEDYPEAKKFIDGALMFNKDNKSANKTTELMKSYALLAKIQEKEKEKYNLLNERELQILELAKQKAETKNKELELAKQKTETKNKELEAKRLEELAKQALTKAERDSIQRLAEKARFEVANSKLKEKEIQAQIKAGESQRQQQQYFFYGILALLALALGFVYYFFQSQQKERKIKQQVQLQAQSLQEKTAALQASEEELRQQSDTVQAQRDDLIEKTQELEALSEELRQQNEVVEARNLELQSLQSTKDLMISAVNHDLRNPLNPIINFSGHYPKKTEKERLAEIHTHAHLMLKLIDNIMQVYRADNLNIQATPNSLHRAVNEAIQVMSLAQNRKPLIINEISVELQAAFDYNYLERVFENLLSNAIKYTPSEEKGGIVRFFAEIDSKKQLVKVSVQDNGKGIPQEQFERIFLPFVNPDAKSIGSAKSVGIGLTFCKTIIEAHKSKIDIQSEVGKGTTFSFELPYIVPELKEVNSQTENLEYIQLNDNEKQVVQNLINEIQKMDFNHSKLRRFLQGMEVGDSEKLQAWKNALLKARETRNKDLFEQMLNS